MEYRHILKFSPILLTFFLGGCGGGGGSSTNSTSAPPPPAVSTSASPIETPVVAVVNTASNNDYYSVLPNIAACQSGTLKESVKQDVLNKINAVRALHKLAPVSYDYTADNEVMQAALASVSNARLDHNIDSTWKCYSEAAKTGADSGNLVRKYSSSVTAWTPTQSLSDWMTEADSKDLGHRRWILNPFLKKVAFGYVDGTGSDGYYNIVNVLKVKYAKDLQTSTATDTLTDFVAYPIGDYPKAYFNKQQYNTTNNDSTRSFSLAVLANPSDFWSNGSNGEVNFSKTTVTITNTATGQTVPLLAPASAVYDYIGLQNNLQWIVDKSAIIDNVTYQVNVDNVAVNGALKSYNYTFKIVP